MNLIVTAGGPLPGRAGQPAEALSHALHGLAPARTFRHGRPHARAILFVTWILIWMPHAVIGVAFATAGANEQSLDFYARWASDPLGATVLISSTVVMLAHFGLSIAGFVGVAVTGMGDEREAAKSTNR